MFNTAFLGLSIRERAFDRTKVGTSNSKTAGNTTCEQKVTDMEEYPVPECPTYPWRTIPTDELEVMVLADYVIEALDEEGTLDPDLAQTVEAYELRVSGKADPADESVVLQIRAQEAAFRHAIPPKEYGEPWGSAEFLDTEEGRRNDSLPAYEDTLEAAEGYLRALFDLRTNIEVVRRWTGHTWISRVKQELEAAYKDGLSRFQGLNIRKHLWPLSGVAKEFGFSFDDETPLVPTIPIQEACADQYLRRAILRAAEKGKLRMDELLRVRAAFLQDPDAWAPLYQQLCEKEWVKPVCLVKCGDVWTSAKPLRVPIEEARELLKHASPREAMVEGYPLGQLAMTDASLILPDITILVFGDDLGLYIVGYKEGFETVLVRYGLVRIPLVQCGGEGVDLGMREFVMGPLSPMAEGFFPPSQA